MTDQEVEVLAIGAGPSNLALAVAVEESGAHELARNTLVLEQYEDVKWQRNLLLPWVRSQVSFLKDLVTLRNPQSRFSFLSYLNSQGRMDEFANMGTFHPYRKEISDYLSWVADSLEHVGIRCNARGERIDVRRAKDGTIDGWTVTLADGDTVSCRDLVVGMGRDARVPDVFRGLPADKVIHSSRYRERIVDQPTDRRSRVVVVGGAQSAAEMFMAVHEDLPLSKPTLVMRSIGLQNYQTSKFTNELFFPSFIDEFHQTSPEARGQILAEMRQTNYAGLAEPFLDELYSMLYRQRLYGAERSETRVMTDIVGARVDGDEVVLDLHDRKTGKVEQLRCDLVLLGTGYEPEMPALVRTLADQVGLDEIVVDRRYRVDLGEPAHGALYLQGVNEATHGIADSLLSVLAHRSRDILGDLLDRRTASAASTASAVSTARAA
ncbi:SidA/IucD/PvdA family monooxygenase [Streptomyces sp. O3]